MPFAARAAVPAIIVIASVLAAGCHDDTPPSDASVVIAPRPAIPAAVPVTAAAPALMIVKKAKPVMFPSRYLRTDAAGIVIVPGSIPKIPSGGH